MPEYLPLRAFRQGLLPDDCVSCAWWQTAGAASYRGPSAADKRGAWLTALERDWGFAGLLTLDTAARPADNDPHEPIVTASVHFAPASSLTRLRELPFPPLPPFSALLLCLRVQEQAPRWAAKRLLQAAICELRRRGIHEVYAVARRSPIGGGAEDCRFFPVGLLADTGFTEVAGSGPFCLMRVESRSLVSLVGQVETAVRRLFARDQEPAPSPAAWAGKEDGVEQGTP